MKEQNKKSGKQIYYRDLNCVAERGKMDPIRSTSQITFFLTVSLHTESIYSLSASCSFNCEEWFDCFEIPLLVTVFMCERKRILFTQNQ